jgi:hypothetical protein
MPAATSVIGYTQVSYGYLADLAFFNINISSLQYLGMAITLVFSLTPAAVKLHREWRQK